MSELSEPMPPGTTHPSMDCSPLLVERIRAAIGTGGGAVSLARYMEMALYEPDLGYYERTPRIVGRGGDFATSVSVGSLFGELMAYWIEHEVSASEGLSDGPLEIVEAGAHDGRWAEDILEALMRGTGKGGERCCYRIVEPSATRRAWQRERLARFGDRVIWSEAMPARVRGVILSNELLDAFPVERWCWSTDQRRWVEQGVCWKEEKFDWIALPTPAPLEWNLPEELQSVLPNGFVRERCPTAVAWWARAAAALHAGCLITLDYGLEAEEFLTPGRSAGTLRAYHRHRFFDDLLSFPGEVDLTAHVDFSAVAEAGLQAGLVPWYRERQSRFLMRILESTQRSPGRFPDWSTQRVRAFQTLTHPEHFGRGFRVLAQGRGGAPWGRA